MSFHAKDSTVTFTWTIAPTGSPPVKADFDITLILPNGTATYTNDAITTYVAPTATVQGTATYDLVLAVVGRYQVTLSIGTDTVHVVNAHREIFSVIPPSHVLTGASATVVAGPRVIPPLCDNITLDIDDIIAPGSPKDVVVAPANNTPQGAWMSPDGVYAFVGQRNFSRILHQFTLSTPFDMDTATFTREVIYDLLGTGSAPNMRAMNFRPNGLQFYIITTEGVLHGYTMTVAWDISTMTADNRTFDISQFTAGARIPGTGNGFYFHPSGNEVYTMWTGSGITTHQLFVPWDVGSICAEVFSQYAIVFNEDDDDPTAGHMTANGKHWIVQVDTRLFQYDMDPAYDMSTIAGNYSGDTMNLGDFLTSLNIVQGVFFTTDLITNEYDNVYVIDSRALDEDRIRQLVF